VQPEFVWRIWEGVVENGKPKGFSRLISGKFDYNFVGYFNGFTRTKKGTGIYFK